jgi:hypothetical protein
MDLHSTQNWCFCVKGTTSAYDMDGDCYKTHFLEIILPNLPSQCVIVVHASYHSRKNEQLLTKSLGKKTV